jgi:hypothetical protein
LAIHPEGFAQVPADFRYFINSKPVLKGKKWRAGFRARSGELSEMPLQPFLPFLKLHGHVRFANKNL